MLLPGVEPGSFRSVNSQPSSWELGLGVNESECVNRYARGAVVCWNRFWCF